MQQRSCREPSNIESLFLNVVLLFIAFVCVCLYCVGRASYFSSSTSLVSVIEKQVGKKSVLLCLGKQESGHSDLMVTEKSRESLQSSSSVAQTVCVAERKMEDVVERVNACSEMNRYCQGAACTKFHSNTCLAVTVSSHRNGQ